MRIAYQGKWYDTNTAIHVCRIEIGKIDDLHMMRASLYRTPRSGEFFLAGTGGGLTAFARRSKDSMGVPIKAIFPITKEAAKNIVMSYGDGDAMALVFDD